MTILWFDISETPVPIDRPVGLLSVQPQYAGGSHITFDVCQWNGDVFELGFQFRSGVGHGCATHWCEVADLTLPPFAGEPRVVKGRPIWRIPDTESNVPRLREEQIDTNCIGFLHDFQEASDDDEGMENLK